MINSYELFSNRLTALNLYLYLLMPVLFGCYENNDSTSNDERPNIIWINAEDISPVFGCYGDTNAYTPNIDKLANRGGVYKNVYTTSPICSPSRSTMITGIHSTSLGTQHLRSEVKIPENLKILPELLNDEGYFTTIYGKTDYNFNAHNIYSYWHDDDAPWRKREDNSPFFSVITFGYSHEGRGNSYERYLKMKALLKQEAHHDSLSVSAPPYFPNTHEFKDLWTRYYDLVSLFDQRVGDVISNLKEDNLLENTIVFVFADHGFGMPRYKRWLNKTGLHVPLVVYLPEKYRSGNQKFTLNEDEKISFIDLAPTTLSLAGVLPPEYMQGRVFIGAEEKLEQEPEILYASKSRADNMYDMSRAIIDDRYIYIRHFLPHLPYIQQGKIFSNEKESLAFLRKYREKNMLPPSGEKMFLPKPLEELYDLQADPHELTNLAEQEVFYELLENRRAALKAEMIRTKDGGFIHEVEIQRQASNSTPYNIAQDYDDFAKLFDVAMQVGVGNEDSFIEILESEKPEIRYWGLVGLRHLEAFNERVESSLRKVISEDESPANQMMAAEIMLNNKIDKEALQILKENLQSSIVVNALLAARTLELVGKPAFLLLPEIQEKLASLKSDDPNKKYIDYNYASFISWSLEEVVKNASNQTLANEW